MSHIHVPCSMLIDGVLEESQSALIVTEEFYRARFQVQGWQEFFQELLHPMYVLTSL